MSVRRNQRSTDAAAYRAWYRTARWQSLRLDQLRAEPLCRFCLAQGIVTPATVCDHITPHRGDAELFWNGPFMSLCKPCHDGQKQAEERNGFSGAVGLDGWPIDPLHPSRPAG